MDDGPGNVTVTYEPNTINVNEFISVTATATDAAGNTQTCQFNAIGLIGKYMIPPRNQFLQKWFGNILLAFCAVFICKAQGFACSFEIPKKLNRKVWDIFVHQCC